MAVARSMRPNSAFVYASLSTFFAPIAALHSVSNPSSCRSSPLFGNSHQCSAYSSSAAPSSVSYRIAVSYLGKSQKLDPSQNVRALDLSILRAKGQTGVAGAPPRSGQDAFFMGSIGNGTGEDVAFGVADGVGGWVEQGIDPSAFSEGLCRYMAHTAGKWEEQGEQGKLSSRKLLQAGYDGVSEDDEITGGGSTACVAIGRTDGTFEVANLGDSGFAHYRPNAMAFFSPPQVHAFNTPYQLSKYTQALLRQYQDFGGEPLRDKPQDAAVSRHKVQHGDILVFGTDGVWDNLNSSDVLDIVRKEMEAVDGWVVDTAAKGAVIGAYDLMDKTEWKSELAHKKGIDERADSKGLISIQEKLAFRIVKSAQIAAADERRMSPFGRELQRWYPGESWPGGKVDDIAVIVAVVVKS